MIRIQEITDKESWESFLLSADITAYPFFQSWNWGEVQKQLGFNVKRVGIVDQSSKKLTGVCQILDIRAKRGHYLHVRHGPILLNFSSKYFDAILAYLREEAKEKGAGFVRISPFVKKESISNIFFKERKFVYAPIHNMDAEVCWVLNIDKPEEQLMREMRKTHRYLIRKASNMSIKIIRSENLPDIKKFLPIYRKLAQEKHFIPHKGVKEEFETYIRDSQEVLLLAEYRGDVIAGVIISFVGNMAIYRHGASLGEFREIPASYLLQWEAIKEAKKRGKKIYNFWGIAPLEDKNHPWKGLTLFKVGFGGKKEEFIHAQDLPISVLYWKTYAIEYLTKLTKGY